MIALPGPTPGLRSTLSPAAGNQRGVPVEDPVTGYMVGATWRRGSGEKAT
jgi:hypothetical protein